MAVESINERTNAALLGTVGEAQMRALFVAHLNLIKALAAKLDADGGVTETDYADMIATYIKE